LVNVYGARSARLSAASGSDDCCRTILDPDCEAVPIDPIPAPVGTAPPVGCGPPPDPEEPCLICTVCCSTWGNACQGVHCENQACVSYLADCDDDSACTSDSCDPQDGCQYEYLCTDEADCSYEGCVDNSCRWVDSSYGASCPDDGESCTWDICDGQGTCIHPPNPAGNCPPDDNECTADYCEDGACVNSDLPDGTPCPDDEDICTLDHCQGGNCTHPEVDCDDDNECTTDTCRSATGCEYDPRPDGTGCEDDGYRCSDDECYNGFCTHPPKECADGNECTYDGCDSETGSCVFPDRPNGTP